MAEAIKTPQQMGEAIQQAQQQAEQIQAPSTAGPIAPQQEQVSGATPQSNTLSLGGGKIVNKNSAQYKALIAKGMTDADISKAYQEKTQQKPQENKPQTQSTPSVVVNTAPQTPLDYQSVAPERKTDIIDNLNKYYQTNPELFSNRQLFDQSFDYGKRGDEQKLLLDNRYNQNLTKKDSISTLGKTPSIDIATMYTSGKLSNEDIDGLKSTNPAKYAEVTAEIERKKILEKYKTRLYTEEKKEDETTPAQQLLDKVNSLFDSITQPNIYQDYKDQINSKEVLDLTNNLSDKEGEVKEIDNQINSTKSELEAQYKNSGMSQGRINAIIQDQTQLLQNKRNSLSIEYQTIADKYNNKMNVIKTNMEIAEKEYSMKQQAQDNQIKKFQLSYGIFSDQQKRDDALKSADIEYERSIAKMQMQEEMNFNTAVKVDKLQNGDINSADPYVVNKAIEKGVDSMMNQFDGLLDSSRDQLVDRIKKDMAGGKTYGEAVAGVTQDIKDKPMYNSWKNNKAGLNKQPTPMGNGYFRDEKEGMISEDKMRAKYGIDPVQVEAQKKVLLEERAANGGVSQYDDISSIDLIRNSKTLGLGVNCGKQCAGYMSDVYNKLTNKTMSFGNTIPEKLSALADIGISAGPIKGGFAVMDFGIIAKNGTNYGHVGYITDISPDGKKVKILNSNYRGTADNQDNTVTEDWVDVSKIKGYSQAPGKGQPTTSSSSVAYETALNNIAPGMTKDARNSTVATMKEYMKTGKVEDAKTLLSNALSDNLKGQEKIKYDFLAGTVDNVQALQSAFDQFKQRNGDTGLFKGTMEEIAKKVGKVKDTELRALASTILISVQQYRKDISGAAFSPQEAAEYESIFPSISNSVELNDTILKSLDSTLKKSQSNFISRKIGQSNYQSIFGNDNSGLNINSNIPATGAGSSMDTVNLFQKGGIVF